jgi:hypothetical protein
MTSSGCPECQKLRTKHHVDAVDNLKTCPRDTLHSTGRPFSSLDTDASGVCEPRNYHLIKDCYPYTHATETVFAAIIYLVVSYSVSWVHSFFLLVRSIDRNTYDVQLSQEIKNMGHWGQFL